MWPLKRRVPDQPLGTGQNWLRLLVVVLFFCWGLTTVLIDSLVPRLKAWFALSYAEVLLTQFSFFLSYLLFSLPAGRVLARLGYARSIVLGLSITALGGLLFAPAVALGRFPPFLLALFVLAMGITLLQVSANPLIAQLGPAAQAPSRLTLAQAFNSLGTTVGPLIGAAVILGAAGAQSLSRVQWPFLTMAGMLGGLALAFWRLRTSDHFPPTATQQSGLRWDLLRQRRFQLGLLAIFTYVGAEVSIGSLLINYLMQPRILGLAAPVAGSLVSLYWGGAMLGRFLGSALLVVLPASGVLLACALGACALVVTSSLSLGWLAAATLLGVGLCNSIQFPVIFSLTLEGLGEATPSGSSLLCLAIVGGALIPPLTGLGADHAGLSMALLVPACCYAVVALFALSQCWPALIRSPLNKV